MKNGKFPMFSLANLTIKALKESDYRQNNQLLAHMVQVKLAVLNHHGKYLSQVQNVQRDGQGFMGAYAFEIPTYGVGIVDVADTPDNFGYTVKFINDSDPDFPQVANSTTSFEDALHKALFKVDTMKKKKQWEPSVASKFDFKTFKYK